jgi:hypothetical protein
VCLLLDNEGADRLDVTGDKLLNIARSDLAGEHGLPVHTKTTLSSRIATSPSFCSPSSRGQRSSLYFLPQDPLASPNARATTLDFYPHAKVGLYERLKKKAVGLIWKEEEDEHQVFKVQQLDVWTPDYVKWSTRLFT